MSIVPYYTIYMKACVYTSWYKNTFKLPKFMQKNKIWGTIAIFSIELGLILAFPYAEPCLKKQDLSGLVWKHCS